MPRFTRTAAAKRDLSEIWDYIAVDNEAAADRALREIDARCALLAGYQKALARFRRHPDPPGQVLNRVCRDNVDYVLEVKVRRCQPASGQLSQDAS